MTGPGITERCTPDQACAARARGTTGYQFTSVEAFDLNGELR